MAPHFLLRLTLLVCAALIGLVAVPAQAQLDFDTKAKFAVLMDYESGMVLFQKEADAPLEPASMAKLMTVAVVFDEIRRGRLKMTDEFFVSENAWRTGGAVSDGSTMFAELNSKISVENLVTSAIVQSGNDASIVLAEGIGGSEATFARMMNQLAGEIGLANSHFTNSTGLPDPAMHSTARDLALLARYLIRTYPQYYPIFSLPQFEWNGIKQPNRNSLVEMGIGVDGLKTGHTEEAGYGTVVSTTDGGRRIIAVLHGLGSINERAEEARKLVTWGSRNFERVPVFPAGTVVGKAQVYGGAEPEVGLVGEGSIDLFLPRGGRTCVEARIVYQGPLRPPVEAGTRVARLDVYCDDKLIQSAPLYAADDVPQGDIFRQSMDALKELAFGWI
jgi:D-alanyl-D-alanine carboxypeptidase (penicillin-binding protein 5/6)